MRKQGYCIQDYRLVFELGYQRRFIGLVKRRLKEGWREIADKIKVSEYTLRVDWGYERSALPLGHAKELAKIASVNLNDLMGNVIMILPRNWGQKRAGAKKANYKRIIIPYLKREKCAQDLRMAK